MQDHSGSTLNLMFNRGLTAKLEVLSRGGEAPLQGLLAGFFWARYTANFDISVRPHCKPKSS